MFTMKANHGPWHGHRSACSSASQGSHLIDRARAYKVVRPPGVLLTNNALRPGLRAGAAPGKAGQQ